MVKKGVNIMSRKGENIRKRKDGRWEGRYQIIENGITKTKSVYAKSYREVKQKRLLIQKSIYQNSKSNTFAINNSKDGFVSAIADEWLVVASKKYKQATYHKYKNIYTNYIYPRFGNVHITFLTNEYIKEQLDMTWSSSRIKSIYTVLNHIYTYAMDKYHLEERYFKRIVYHKTTNITNTFDQSEQAKLLRYLTQDTDIYKLGVYICLSTGLRLGEVCALKWCDIDMELKLLHVNHTVQRLSTEKELAKTALIESSPKSFHSKREIPLSNQLYELLLQFYSTETYVLNGTKPMDPRTLQYRFQKILKESQIKKTNFHTLRHTFATNCIQMGADIKSVSEVLGHSDVKITLNRYVHPSIETKREYLNSLSSIYGQISGQNIS